MAGMLAGCAGFRPIDPSVSALGLTPDEGILVVPNAGEMLYRLR